ncbi:MAG: 3-hydroxyisobutyrate dehydrogenase [Yoonia sp.]|jgi:3-hydroxyisobutyrate dehydrogenase
MADIIGVAGCGRMGFGMLANLRKAGLNAGGFGIRQIDGVKADINACAQDLTTVFTVVRDTAETDAVLFDVQSLIAKAQSLQRIVINSTLSRKYVKGPRARSTGHHLGRRSYVRRASQSRRQHIDVYDRRPNCRNSAGLARDAR